MYLRLFSVIFLSVQFLFVERTYSQNNSNLTHYFMNPFSINPSFAGADGKSSVFLTYRKQWVGIEGAPTVANFSFHTPVGKKVGFGLNVSNASRGLLNTTSGYLTVAYGVSFSKAVRLRFGISGGAAYNGVDVGEIDNLASDPELQGLLESNIYLIGNAGISLQFKTLNFGISIPNFFSDEYFSNEKVNVGETAPFENALLFLTNRFYFGDGKHVFEPFLLYRYSDVGPAQFEGSAAIHLNHVVWFGGSYKQDFGISAFGGIKVQKSLGIGYAYSLKNTGLNEINSPTHEIQLSILFGERDKDISYYSFIDTSKPDIKTKRQRALEKQREEAAKKRIAAAQAKRAEERQIAEERQKIEAAKKAEEAKVAEETRQAEEARQAEEVRKAEEARQAKADEQLQAEKQQAEEKIQEEQKPPVGKVEQKEEPSDKNLIEEQSTDERVVVKRGGHMLELQPGEYVVVGAFNNYESAEEYSDELFFKGYQTRFGYISERGDWYVYIHKAESIENATQERDKYRKIGAFSKAWVLSVQ